MKRCRKLVTSPCLPVLMGLFLNGMSYVGMIKVVGILFEDMSISLNTTVTEFGLSLGVFTMLVLFPVPFVLIAYRKVKCPRRVPLLLGAVMASMGIILASFATSTWHVTVCLAMSAVGLCIIQSYLGILLMEELTENFNMLYYLASSGCAVGMVLPPLVAEVLNRAYGWRGALLIIGALMTNIIPCVLCIRTRNNNGVGIYGGRCKTQNTQRGSDESNNSDMVWLGGKESSHRETYEQNGTSNFMSRYLETECSNDQHGEAIPLISVNRLTEVQAMVYLDHTPQDVINGIDVPEGAGCSNLGNNLQHCRYGNTDDTSSHDSNSSSEEPPDSISSRKSIPKESREGRWLSCTEILKYVRIHDVPADDDDDDDSIGPHDESSILNGKVKTDKKNNQRNPAFKKILDMIVAFRTTPFYTDPRGNLVYICSPVFGFVYSGWHAFLVPHALERGISPFYVLLITAFAAFGNLSGRISAGILTNSLVYPASLYLVLCVVDSLLLLAYTYITNNYAMAVISCISAGSIAGRAVIPLLVAKARTSPDKYHYVYGACQMSLGAGMLLGGFVSGLVVDQLSSYDAAFRLLAAVEVGAFFLMLPLRLLRSP